MLTGQTRIISSWYCKNGSLCYLFCVSQNLVKLGGGAHKKLGMEGWKRNRVNGVTGIDFIPLVDAENLNPVAWLQNREIVLSLGVSRSLQGNIHVIQICLISVHMRVINTPFHSCGLSIPDLEWTWGWGWPCFDTNLFLFLWKLCLKTTS